MDSLKSGLQVAQVASHFNIDLSSNLCGTVETHFANVHIVHTVHNVHTVNIVHNVHIVQTQTEKKLSLFGQFLYCLLANETYRWVVNNVYLS